MDLVTNLESGAIGGVAGGTVMAAAMVVGKQTGILPELPPAKLERELEQRGGFAEKTGPKQEQALGVSGHMAFSALLGAGYGLLQSAVETSPVTGGLLYGLGVYAANRVGIGPSLNLTPSPSEEDPMTVGRNVMMHMVFGLVTGLTYDQVKQHLAGQDGHVSRESHVSAFIAP